MNSFAILLLLWSNVHLSIANPGGYDYCGSPCHGTFVDNNGAVVANVTQAGKPVYSYVGGQSYTLTLNSGGPPVNDVSSVPSVHAC